MFTSIVIGALSAAGMIQQTDTIIDAGDASRLALESFRGEVVVRTWDRDAVQVNADHPSSRFIEIDKGGNTIHVEVGRDRLGVPVRLVVGVECDSRSSQRREGLRPRGAFDREADRRPRPGRGSSG